MMSDPDFVGTGCNLEISFLSFIFVKVFRVDYFFIDLEKSLFLQLGFGCKFLSFDFKLYGVMAEWPPAIGEAKKLYQRIFLILRPFAEGCFYNARVARGFFV